MRHLLVFIAILAALQCTAQNLVPNPSFENYNACPTGYSSNINWTIDFSPTYSSFPTVQSWVNPVYLSSSDYLNACAGYAQYVNIPNSITGYQQARTGNACAGIYVASSTDTVYREYVETKLNQQMIAGHQYYVSFYLSLGTIDSILYCWVLGVPQAYNIMATDSIGIHFSDTLVYDTAKYLNIPLHVASPSGQFIIDTTNWVKISGTYTASGNEQWLTLGKGYYGQKALVDTIKIVDSSSSQAFAYYFVDDICVLDMSAPAQQTDSVVITSTFPVIIQGQTQGNEYLWNTGDTTAAISINDTGTYIVQVFGECTYSVDTVRVYVETGFDNTALHTTQLSPNPFTNSAILGFNNPQHKLHTLHLYDIQGRLIRETKDFTGKEIIIERGNLDAGCYYYELKREDGAAAKGMLLIQ